MAELIVPDKTEELLVVRRLENIDKELHLLIDEFKPKKSRVSPKEIRELLASKVKHDVDTTKLIREMRDKEYDI